MPELPPHQGKKGLNIESGLDLCTLLLPLPCLKGQKFSENKTLSLMTSWKNDASLVLGATLDKCKSHFVRTARKVS